MTPAINALKKANVDYQLHEYQHDPGVESYGEEAAQALGVPAKQVFKTLLVCLNGDKRQLAVAVVPVCQTLDLKKLAKACNAKKVSMAAPADAERATGYVVGGISPLGQKKRLPLWLDHSAMAYGSIFISGGRRGLDIELTPNDLLQLTQGGQADIAKMGAATASE